MPARSEKVRIEDFIYTQSIGPHYPSTTTRRGFVKDCRNQIVQQTPKGIVIMRELVMASPDSFLLHSAIRKAHGLESRL